jgi:glycosyltransferase involved in cell wall biosynthesis
MRLSVVVISRNEGKWLRRTIENLEDTIPASAEIMIVDDGSTDGSTDSFARRRGRVRLHRVKGFGVAKARNFGARQASGDALVFADAHLSLDALWWQPLLEQIEDPRVGAAAPGITQLPSAPVAGYGITFSGPHLEVKWLRRKPKSPQAAPILPGCCLAMRRDVLERAGGGWDDGLLHRGNVDNETSVRLWLLGYELMIVPEVVVQHRFRQQSPYAVGWPEYLHNRLRLAFVHFNPQRLARVVARLRKYPGFGEALALLADSDIAARRRELFCHRTRNDDWYFERFRLNW